MLYALLQDSVLSKSHCVYM